MNKEFIAIYEMLKKYESLYCEELVYKEKMLELINTCDDCFLRSCRVGHFTSSAFLLNKAMTHVCLMHHTKLDKWMQLGGHCDGDPAVLNVSIKEAQEESGIENIRPLKHDVFDLDIHLIPLNSKDESHYHFDVRFLLHAYDNDTLKKNHESKELKWVEKFDRSIPRNVIRMFEKWKKNA
jgi:8-oxo-dGTP pyrophosphatase MutT (NUDIX family)